MSKGHEFNFEGGDILTGIGAAWFVSYSYYNYVDKNHVNWNQKRYTPNSLNSRQSKYRNSAAYHKAWLNEVQNMQQLDKQKNFLNLNSVQVKEMARHVLSKM